MSGADEDDGVISEEFLIGQKLILDLENSSSSQPDYKEKAKECKARLNKAAILVNQLNLFSPNETARDFHATQLRYALIPFYLGLVEQLVGEQIERRVRVEIAKRCFENFYGLCERLELISEAEKQEIELLEEKEDLLSPQQRREILVNQARRNKEHVARIQELTERKLRLLNREGVGAEESDTTLNEVEEELVHSQIKIAIARSYREIRTIEREIPLLDRMLELEKDPKRAQAERDAHARLVATSKTDSKFCPYTIVKDGRGGLRKKVFCAHWIQPTVTIEEAGEIDYRIAMQEQANRDRAQAEMRRLKARNSDEEFDPEFDSDPDDDEKLYKARAWDEYKDDHPSGSGNTMANVG